MSAVADPYLNHDLHQIFFLIRNTVQEVQLSVYLGNET
jgi:hypothetical protein